MFDAEKIIDLIRHGESLKTVDRSGWKLAGIEAKRIESVAEHSYGCGFAALVIANHLKSEGLEIDLGKVALMAILHDLPESITGDIATTKEFARDPDRIKEKELAEQNAMNEIMKPLGETLQGFLEIWSEFNRGESLESRVVRGADIIDMLVHTKSLEEAAVPPEKTHQFFETSKSRIESIDIEIISKIYEKLSQDHESKL
ncbi:MAG: HD family hydrolase [Candidatus Thorarchaeota archaeon]